jgi:hypothetical protein
MMLNISLAHGTSADHWHMALLRIFVKETAIQLGEKRDELDKRERIYVFQTDIFSKLPIVAVCCGYRRNKCIV